VNIKIPSDTIFGIGERNGPFLVKNGTYTIWNKFNNGIKSTGIPGQNLNGYHPTYLARE